MRSDIFALGLLGFALVYDFTIYSASILPYVQSLSESEEQASFLYALAISLPAFFQVLITSSCGFLARRVGMKRVILLLQMTGMCGSLLYALAEWPFHSPWAIIAGKCFSGANAGSMGLSMAYVSVCTPDREARTIRLGNLRAVNLVATFPSSIMGLVLSIPALAFSIGSYNLNAYTYPPWSSLILQAISLGTNVFCLRSVEQDAMEPPSGKGPGAKGAGGILYLSKGVGLIFLLSFFTGYYVSHLLYAMPVVLQDGYGWSVIQYAPVWIGISVVGIAGVQGAKWAARRLGEKLHLAIVPTVGCLCVLCALMVVGSVSIGSLPRGVGEACFLVGTETAFGAFQIIQISSMSIFSHLVPPAYLVKMMPLMSATASVGKIAGPLVCALEVRVWGIGLLFYSLMFLAAVVMFVCIALNDHLHGIDFIGGTHSSVSSVPAPAAETVVITEKEEDGQDRQPLLATSINLNKA